MNLHRRMRLVLGAACVLLMAGTLRAADQLNLWPDNSPELKGVDPKHIPTLELYPGPEAAGKQPAVLICPAGGYKHHSDSSRNVKWLNGLGIAAYVVKYRLPVYGHKHPTPLHDAQRAVRIIRQNAEPWGLDAGKIGVIGGSSGGHVASTLATHFDRAVLVHRLLRHIVISLTHCSDCC